MALGCSLALALSWMVHPAFEIVEDIAGQKALVVADNAATKDFVEPSWHLSPDSAEPHGTQVRGRGRRTICLKPHAKLLGARTVQEHHVRT